MSGLDRDEYRVLRETIAARGHLRPALMLGGMAAWAATFVAVLALLPYPLASAVPLLILVVTFEAIRTLLVGSERIGRYLQVFFEEPGDSPRPLADTPSWERVAMVFGGTRPGAGGHPLFVPIFLMAAAVNFLAVVLPNPVPIELGLLAVPHLAFVVWLLVADRSMRAQRTADLERFRQLRMGKS